MIRLGLALFLAAELLFLPLIAAPGERVVTLRHGEAVTVTCESELLDMMTQTRTSVSVVCRRDADLPYVPTPTPAP